MFPMSAPTLLYVFMSLYLPALIFYASNCVIVRLSMQVYVYTCVNVNVHVHVYLFVYMHLLISFIVHIHLHIQIHIQLHIYFYSKLPMYQDRVRDRLRMNE